MQILKSLQNKINAILRNSKCLILLLKNIMLLRKLHVNLIELYDQFVIQGNEVDLEWNIKGCHKIKINGIGILSGNINGIRYKLLDIQQPIDICFYGVTKKQRITIFYNGVTIDLKEKFKCDLAIPVVTAPSKTMRLHHSHFSDLQIDLNLNNISVSFDTFYKHNY